MTQPTMGEALVRVLTHHGVDVVLDVGANVGQYATRLRRDGYNGRIVSFEPLAAVHSDLAERAVQDECWNVPPPLALGAQDGDITLNVSAETDMSSALPLTSTMSELLDSATATETEIVPMARLDTIFDTYVSATETAFLKIDVQGLEPAVLDGAHRCLERIVGLQLELSLVPIYVGEVDYRMMIERIGSIGYDPVLFIPGYFNRRTARQLQMDGVFIRRNTLTDAAVD